MSIEKIFSGLDCRKFSESESIELGYVYLPMQEQSQSYNWQLTEVQSAQSYLYLMKLDWQESDLVKIYRTFRQPIQTLNTRRGELNLLVVKMAHLIQPLSGEQQEVLNVLQIDHALLSADIKLNNIQLIVSDMDSTFIQQEVIDEIGAEAGIKQQIAEITERAMQGDLDFSQSLRQRVSLLKGVPLESLDQIFDRLKLSPGIKSLVSNSHQANVKIALVSGGFTYFVERFKQMLKLHFVLANQLQSAKGVLTGMVEGDIVDAKMKAITLKKLTQELRLDSSQVAAMGDGANDIELLNDAALSVAYKAKPALKSVANCHLEYGDFRLVAALIGLA